MKIRRTVSAISSKVVLLIAFLSISGLGCHEDTVSPCYDCWDGYPNGRYTEVMDRSFSVDQATMITVDDFVGKVTYRTGEPGHVRVKAIKRAAQRSHLDRITVVMSSRQAELEIWTDNPDEFKNASVDLEITAPADARPNVAVGVGDIDYRGRPWGGCHFATGVGTARLRLPADVNITVDLTTGVGSIILGFAVDGSIHRESVRGRIGRGDEGSVRVSTGVGNIYLSRQ